jgi:hypothetical protein
MTTRDNAIALLVEKLREIENNADHATKQHTAVMSAPGSLMDFGTYDAHREAATLHYVLADLCGLLIEGITSTSLLDQLAVDFPIASAAPEPCSHCGAPGHKTNDCEDERPAQEYLDAPTESEA